MESEQNREIVPIQAHGPVTRHEFEILKFELAEARRDLETYERRWVDQNRRINKLRSAYEGLRRWQSWILGGTAVGSYLIGFLSDWFKPK
jgi:hypothetical protein